MQFPELIFMRHFLLSSLMSLFTEQIFSFFRVPLFLILTELRHIHFFNCTNMFTFLGRLTRIIDLQDIELLTSESVYMSRPSDDPNRLSDTGSFLLVKAYTCRVRPTIPSNRPRD
jgi:hypothetical protein